MFSSTSPATVRSKAGAILRVTSGNFLEQFDFFLFGFYATYIAHTFFPASSEFASLMMTFAVFGAGFLMRPIGAIVLGAYIDKVGRRKGLIVTLSIMAAGTFLIVLIPSYQSIGLWAPLLVLTGRLLQGFSAGAELGGGSVYLAENATPAAHTNEFAPLPTPHLPRLTDRRTADAEPDPTPLGPKRYAIPGFDR